MKKKASSTSKRAGGAGNSDAPAPGTIKDVCAVIRMGVNDTAIGYALDTCLRAAFHTVYIVDANRGEAEYASQPLIAALRAKRIKVVFLTSDAGIYNRMKHDYMVVDVPPDFSAMKEQTHGLIEHARVKWRQSKYRRFAMAPTYEQPASYANGFVLMLHVFWCLMGLFVARRMYRGTYMKLTVLRREADVIFLPEEYAFNRDKEPYVFGSKGCRSKTPPDRYGMDQFLYLVNRETLTLRIFVLMSLYVLSLMVPVWWIAVPVNPTTNAWDIFPLLDSLKGLISSGRLVWWIVHGIIAAYFTGVYFDTMSYAYAFLLPFYAPFFWLFFLYAKTFWRGYAGDAPKLNLPPMLPRAVEGATFAPLEPVLPVEGEEGELVKNEEDEQQREEEEEEEGSAHSGEEGEEGDEEEGQEESVIPSPKVVSKRRKPATAKARKNSGDNDESAVGQSPSSDEKKGGLAAKSPKSAPKSSTKSTVKA